MAAIALAGRALAGIRAGPRFHQSAIVRVDQAIAMASLFAAFHLNAKAIAALSQSGSTALWMEPPIASGADLPC